MEQQVTVIDVDRDLAIVRGRRASACGDCAGKASCSTMGSWLERSIELRVPNRLGARRGDEIILEVPDRVLLRVTFKLYAVPMLIFVVLGVVAKAVLGEGQDAFAALAALTGVVGYYILNHFSAGTPQALDVKMIRFATVGDAQACTHHLHSSE